MVVCGSPRKGNSELVALKAKELLEKKGVETELVLLREKNIRPWHEGHENTKDDMGVLLEIFEKADAYLFVSPTFYGMPPGILKNFIDRTDVFFGQQEKFHKKVASVVAIGASPLGGGIEHNGECLRLFFRMFGVRNLDSLYLQGKDNAEEILEDKNVKEKLPVLVEHLVSAAGRF